MKTIRRLKKLEVHSGLIDTLLIVGLICGAWLKLIYSQLSTKINPIPLMSQTNTQMYVTSLVTILLVMSVLYTIGMRRYMILLWIGSILMTVLFLADTLYGRYYFNPITLSIFFSQLYMADDVSGSAFGLIKWKDLVFFMDYLVLLPFYIITKPMRRKMVKPISLWKHIVYGLVVFFVGLTVVFSLRYQALNTVHYVYERKNIAKDLGLLYYHGYDIKDRIDSSLNKQKITEEDIEYIYAYDGDNSSESNAFSGIAKGRNLYIIQLEAIMGYLIDYDVDGQEVMPFLNNLKKTKVCIYQIALFKQPMATRLMQSYL